MRLRLSRGKGGGGVPFTETLWCGMRLRLSRGKGVEEFLSPRHFGAGCGFACPAERGVEGASTPPGTLDSASLRLALRLSPHSRKASSAGR